MIHKHRKLTTIMATVLLLAVAATPAAARTYTDPCCCVCVPPSYIPCPPDGGSPDGELPDSDLPQQPETPDETPSQPDSSISAAEREVAELVNEIRAEYGLAPLTLSEELCAGARVKSEDMRSNGYFDHTSPTYGSPFDLMHRLDITYSAAAENIAMGYDTAEAVVAGWMASPSHRANILSDNYTHIGVGRSGDYWTQWFTR